MKTKLIAVIGLFAASVMLAQDTNSTPPLEAPAATSAASATNTNKVADTNHINLWDAVKAIGKDGYSVLKDLNFDNGITVEPFLLYHNGANRNDFGGGLAVSTANTNGLNFGFAVATINDSANKKWDFYDASLSLSLGTTFNVPWLHIPAYTYIETGPAFNLAHPNAVLEQSIAGVKFFLGPKKNWSVGGGVGHNSEWASDAFYILHASHTF